MDAQRAKQIFESKGVIEVLHKGRPVWIEGINGDVAAIKELENGNRKDIPVNQLIEPYPEQVQ